MQEAEFSSHKNYGKHISPVTRNWLLFHKQDEVVEVNIHVPTRSPTGQGNGNKRIPVRESTGNLEL